MNSASKCLVYAAALMISLVIAMAIIVNGILTRSPNVSKLSPSGRYLIASVPASSLLTPRVVQSEKALAGLFYQQHALPN